MYPVNLHENKGTFRMSTSENPKNITMIIYIYLLFVLTISYVKTQDRTFVTSMKKEDNGFHLFMNCSSSKPPLEFTVEFLVNTKTQHIIKYFKGQCYIKRRMCHKDECSCTANSYTVNFPVNFNYNHNIIACEMRFQNGNDEGGHILVKHIVRYNETGMNNTEIYDQEEEVFVRGSKPESVTEKTSSTTAKEKEPSLFWPYIIVGIVDVVILVAVVLFLKKANDRSDAKQIRTSTNYMQKTQQSHESEEHLQDMEAVGHKSIIDEESNSQQNETFEPQRAVADILPTKNMKQAKQNHESEGQHQNREVIMHKEFNDKDNEAYATKRAMEDISTAKYMKQTTQNHEPEGNNQDMEVMVMVNKELNDEKSNQQDSKTYELQRAVEDISTTSNTPLLTNDDDMNDQSSGEKSDTFD